MFVRCISNGQYITVSDEAPLPQYLKWCTVSGYAVLDGILYVCLTRWGAICVVLCTAISCVLRDAFKYTFKGFGYLRHVAFGSYS
jgi:hypothetical protein